MSLGVSWDRDMRQKAKDDGRALFVIGYDARHLGNRAIVLRGAHEANMASQLTAFCLCVVEGGMTPSEAYDKAFPEPTDE